MRTLLAVLVATGFLVRCSSMPPTAEELQAETREIAAKNTAGAVQLIFAYRRNLQLFTCKCEMVSLGGVHREMNLLTSARQEGGVPMIEMTGGATFIPDAAELGFLSPKQLHALRGLMVEAMNTLGVEVYGLSSQDLALGETELARLQALAQFTFVSANVKAKEGRLKLVPYVEKTVNGQAFLITSFISTGAKGPGLEVFDPVSVLKDLVARRKDNAIIVVIAEETFADRREMNDKIPGLNVWLGSSPVEVDETFNIAYDESTIFASPLPQGRSLARVRLERRSAARPPIFTSPEYVEQARERLAMETAPESVSSAGPSVLARKSRIYTARKTYTHKVAVDRINIARKYDEPSNALHAIMERARKVAGFSPADVH